MDQILLVVNIQIRNAVFSVVAFDYLCKIKSKKNINFRFCILINFFPENRRQTSTEVKLQKAEDRQGIPLPVIGAPFLAATAPLAAAGAVGVYGAYGDVIIGFLNSLLGW